MAPRKKAGEVTKVENPGQAVAVQEQPRTSMVAGSSQYLPMLEQAISSNLDIDRLERFMALQKEWEANNAKKQFLEAMSWFQSDIPVISKKGHADYGEGKANYDYAKLEDIAEGIKPYLAKNGLSYSWECAQAEGGYITVTCTMSHIGGHSKSSTMTSTPDQSGNKVGVHQIASARSYLKRYTLLDVAGVTVGGEDDDAQEYIENNSFIEQGKPQEIAYYPDERFNEKLPQFTAKLESGAWRTQDAIDFMEERDITLSPAQIERLTAIETAITGA